MPNSINIFVRFLKDLLYFICMSVLLSCMNAYCMHAWYSQRPEGVRSPGTRVMVVYELPCGCWKPHIVVGLSPQNNDTETSY